MNALDGRPHGLGVAAHLQIEHDDLVGRVALEHRRGQVDPVCVGERDRRRRSKCVRSFESDSILGHPCSVAHPAGVIDAGCT